MTYTDFTNNIHKLTDNWSENNSDAMKKNNEFRNKIKNSNFLDKDFIKKHPFSSYDNLKRFNINLNNPQNSYKEDFLQLNISEDKLRQRGIHGIFSDIFPIYNNDETIIMRYEGYSIGESPYSAQDAKRIGLSYTVPLKIKIRMTIYDINQDEKKELVGIKEQEIYVGQIPMMTDEGSFIINGVSRVIVSQIHKSPGILFNKVVDNNKNFYSASIVPYRGSWLELESDIKDIIHFKIDKQKKHPVTILLKALGMNDEDILREFYKEYIYKKTKDGWVIPFHQDVITRHTLQEDLVDNATNKILYPKGKVLTKRLIKQFISEGVNALKVSEQHILGKASAGYIILWPKNHNIKSWKNKRILKVDISDSKGTVLVKKGFELLFSDLKTLFKYSNILNISERDLLGDIKDNDSKSNNILQVEAILLPGEEITAEHLEQLKDNNINKIPIIAINEDNPEYIRNTLVQDNIVSYREAIKFVYNIITNDDLTLDNNYNILDNIFFNPKRYDLSECGRVKINDKLNLKTSISNTTLTKNDIIGTLRYLIDIIANKARVDDVDHLGNRRIKSVAELISNQFRIGVIRIAKSIEEHLNRNIENMLPEDIISPRILIAVLNDFFTNSQLSQLIDQTNSLSEISHKRRISALGPGGINRDRAGFEVRDVHATHYGRICPIETPEGQNIGLINALSTYAKINEYGFIETPYIKVVDGKVLDQCDYLSADEEVRYKIATHHLDLDEHNKIIPTQIECRYDSNLVIIKKEEVNYIPVSPGQIISVGSSMIPFIESNDSARALMGANMQRQAVPLLTTERPLVSTGMESLLGKYSNACIIAKHDGVIIYTDVNKIIIKRNEIDINEEMDRCLSKSDITKYVESEIVYYLTRLDRSNSSTIIQHKAIVKPGDLIKKGDILADGSSIDRGHLSLGRNILVAFVPWYGYTYEESVGVSSRLVREDIYTSIHIEKFQITTRDTKLGPEEITRDIPNLAFNHKLVRNLDESGIVRIGSKIIAGDILIGKVTPKANTKPNPEEQLVAAIFKGQSGFNDSVKDTSLYAPVGFKGTVIDVRIFSRRGIQKNARAILIGKQKLKTLQTKKENQIHSIYEAIKIKLFTILKDQSKYQTKPISVLLKTKFNDENIDKLIAKLSEYLKNTLKMIEKEYQVAVNRLQSGESPALLGGALEIIEVYIASKRKIQSGDKVAGRHGNKGVISKIIPEEDMPFLEDGTTVDMILNPLAYTRMNLGQILELHLGAASIAIGKKINQLVSIIKDCNNSIKIQQSTELKLRNYIKEVYGPEADLTKQIDGFDLESLLIIGNKLKKGIEFVTPAFEGAKIKDIVKMLKLGGIPTHGQFTLRDGTTGELIDRHVTVGHKYILRLHHLVDDKIHARSTGPYTLLQNQPLSGKSHSGGQRFGEMECWALQAYGAAYNLREMLTTKSDDINGRSEAYDKMVRDDYIFSPGIPESFNVLIKILSALCIDLTLINCDEVDQDNNYTNNIYDLLNKKNINFDAIRISILSPEKIKSTSYGEIKKADTINYKTDKPETDGLFCAKIFGPINDYECLCGKYKRMKYKGTVCQKCGVEVTTSNVRRFRMGHIELATPIAHIWFLKSISSAISVILDINAKNLEKILSFEYQIVLDPLATTLEKNQILTPHEYNDMLDEFGDSAFLCDTGGEAIQYMLKHLDLKLIEKDLEKKLLNVNSEIRKKKYLKKLKLIKAFLRSGVKPEWMMLNILPVLPPDLRPLLMLDNGRCVTSDLNELYRRVINRNNRLKKLIATDAPKIVLQNEKRILQEAVDSLIDNGRRGAPVKNASNKKPLKSLGDTLKGKQGMFRKNLLGKRVDYSGRSVIVCGPELKLHQCGLPKQIALELFKPAVYHMLIKGGKAVTLSDASRIVSETPEVVSDILEKVISDRVVLLNRAPTLHRLSIQAFNPVLIEGKAIQLHPLVCTAFNADFDGDQMSVHVPLSLHAQVEARVLMMSNRNILNPSNGKPMITPDKDLVFGLYYLTLMNPTSNMDNVKTYSSVIDILLRLENKKINLWDVIKFKNIEDDKVVYYETTPGRLILWSILPNYKEVSFSIFNHCITKSNLSILMDTIYQLKGLESTVALANQMVKLGFKYALQSGISIGLGDLVVDQNKNKIIDRVSQKIFEYEQQYQNGLITQKEKRKKTIQEWYKCTDKIADDMMQRLKKPIYQVNGNDYHSSIYHLLTSGARGDVSQTKQILGMRGVIIKPSGEIMETPIKSNFKEGLQVMEYFHSTHGARKGLSDLALRTADAGYLTRRLVDVAQDCIIKSIDCNTNNGIVISEVRDGGEVTVELEERVYSRCIVEDIYDKKDKNKILVKANTIIDKDVLHQIMKSNITSIKVRSVLTCALDRGVCAKCYGLDLSTGKLVEEGMAIGIIAAQSIGEPGTQLTMRTFHIGGIAKSEKIENSFYTAEYDCTVKIPKENNIVTNSEGKKIMLSRSAVITLVDKDNVEKDRLNIPYGATLLVQNSQKISALQKIAEWDPYYVPIIAAKKGKALLDDVIDGETIDNVFDNNTNTMNRVVKEVTNNKVNKYPIISLYNDDNEKINIYAKYELLPGIIINIDNGSEVIPGDVIAKIPKKVHTNTKDITGGLPRVQELLEGKITKDAAIISDRDGIVDIIKDYKVRRKIIIKDLHDENNTVEYVVSKSSRRNILIQPGDHVKRGDILVDGNNDPHDILKIFGVEALNRYIVDEVQSVYRLQGVRIHDKHIEIIIKQMLQRVRITDPGDSHALTDEIVDKYMITLVNKKLASNGKRIAQYEIIMQGITKASLQSVSFLAAASFQETSKILSDAAIEGRLDILMGLKENVITGRLMPAGTGFKKNQIRYNKVISNLEADEYGYINKEEL